MPMTVTAIRPVRTLIVSLFTLAVAASSAVGQNSQWSPSRSSTRPAANAGGSSAAFVPEWQRSPSPAGRYESVIRTSAVEPIHTSSRSPASRGSSARLAYDVPLAPGEQLVGEAEMSEAAPAGRTTLRTAHRGEVLPVPDGVSNGGSAPGEVIREGVPSGQGAVELDPQFDYEYGGGGHGCCDSCTQGGDCFTCTPNRDPWANPSCCPECGMHGHHHLNCSRFAMCLENCWGFIFKESSVFVGVQSFKGPLDRGVNGNYGFNEGVNLAGPLVPFPRKGIGYQVGARWVQSNLSGNAFDSSSRNQQFFTAGLFHRAYRNRGLQGGVVYDHLNDDYYREVSVGQVRFEASVLNGCGHEIGMWGTAAVEDDEEIPEQRLPRPQLTNMGNLFYRYSTDEGHQTRLWCGLTSDDLIVVGADMRVPVSNRIDFTGGFNYIIPDEGNENHGELDESWNIGMNLVWYFGRRRDGIHVTPYRQLFNVADNGTMMFKPHD
jgi:hypothetical protein